MINFQRVSWCVGRYLRIYVFNFLNKFYWNSKLPTMHFMLNEHFMFNAAWTENKKLILIAKERKIATQYETTRITPTNWNYKMFSWFAPIFVWIHQTNQKKSQRYTQMHYKKRFESNGSWNHVIRTKLAISTFLI